MNEHSQRSATAPRPTTSAPLKIEFGPLTVSYPPSVLVPRTWTLMQSTWAAELAQQAAAGPIVELCAGAGHIGLAAAVLCDRDLVQVEIDIVAGEYCRLNAISAGRAARTEVRVMPLEQALTPGESFPIMIADPPYLPSDEIGRWPDDPQIAIDGGPDGLRVIDQCLQLAAEHVAAGGVMLLQVAGARQAEIVTERVGAVSANRLVAVETREYDDDRAVALLHRR